MSVPILQPLNYKRAIVDGQGRPTPEFQQKWRRLYEIAGAIPDVTTAAAMSALLDLIASGEGTILRRGPETWAGLPTPGGTLKFLRADGSYAEPDVAVDEADIDLSDVLTNNVSSARHGFTPKLPNDATMYLDGTGQWSTPAGGGGGGGGGGNVATLGLVCTASKSYSGGTQPFTSPDWTSDFSDGAGLSFASNVVTVGSGVSFIEHTITASVASGASSNVGVYIYKNGAAVAIAAGEIPGSSGQNLWTVSTGPLPTEEGDTWQIGLYPGSSGSSTITPGDTPFAWHMAASGDSAGNSAVGIVQAKAFAVSSGVPSITLDDAPTPGNLLVFIGARWTVNIDIAGVWQQVLNKSATNSLSGVVAAKLVTDADGATQQPYTTSTGWAGVLVEVSGAALSTITAYSTAIDKTGADLAVSVAAPGSACLTVGAFTSAAKTNTAVSLDGATALGSFASDTGSSNGGPHSAQGFRLTSTAKGAAAVTGTYSASGNYNQCTFVTFAPSPF